MQAQMEQDEHTQQGFLEQETLSRLLLSRNFLKEDISAHIDWL